MNKQPNFLNSILKNFDDVLRLGLCPLLRLESVGFLYPLMLKITYVRFILLIGKRCKLGWERRLTHVNC